ncbi:MAG: hypothetical protein F2808_04900 [Actinobacteria bacterium]|uniref:Unannotated protein n=1 Tax=freshwater metagenome TaxID=449393 RepID=A0A6J7GBF1_9ZZZZ|nr:hypothetical protein [Actinomycetota bacterium]
MDLKSGPFRRAQIALVSVLALVMGLFVAVGSASAPATAADMSQFRAGNIIADALFFDGNAMSVAEVQAFLNAKVPSCAGGYVCLKNYTETTRTIAGNPMCSTYQGAANESAATIIYKVGKACGISQRTILVMLQKEQGLVTSTAPSSGRFRSAMGAGCPDTAACDSEYYGFFNQVHYGSYQLKRYTQPAGTGAGTAWDTRFDLWKPVGQVSNLLYSPVRDGAGNYACGTKPVLIENQATHALYIYTPYTPNQAALNAGYGLGDGCSAYGNRNFYNYYSDWFGSTQTAAPILKANPGITGQPGVGSTLTASPGEWVGSPTPTITYQWQACAANVPATTSTQPANCTVRTAGVTYVPTASDVGKFVTVKVVAANTRGSVTLWTPSTAGPVGSPTLTTAPVLSGAAAVGAAATVNAGTWGGTPTRYDYQWFVCTADVPGPTSFAPAGCSAISGATSATLSVTSAAWGKALSARVSATNASGTNAVWTASRAVTLDPYVTGAARTGAALTGVIGQWLGATSFPPVPTDGPTYGSGYPVKAIQTYTSRAGFPTDVDGIFGPQTQGNVALYQAKYGLAADGVVGPGTWAHMVSSNTPSTYVLQWQRCSAPLVAPANVQPTTCADIAGQTAAAYTATAADVGTYVSLRVTATRGAIVERRWSVTTAVVVDSTIPTPTPTPTPTPSPTPTAIVNPPTITGVATTVGLLTAATGQWLGAPTAAIPTDGPTYSANAYSVKAIQTYLTRAGIATTVDGAYGPGTAASVKTFQTRNGLTSDGIVGPATWNKMQALKLYTTYQTQWIRCPAAIPTATVTGPVNCTDITAATTTTYRPVAADSSAYLAIRVFGESGTQSATRWSASTALVPAATPTPTSTPTPSATASPSATPTPTPTTSTPTPSATASPSATPTPTPTPTPTSTVPTPAKSPTASGTAKVGQSLLATSGEWLGAPTPAIPADGPTYGANRYPVKSIQTYLTRAGFATTADGAYGAQTTANVRAFQSKYGLLSDGQVGPVSWSKMLSLKLYTSYSYQWVSCSTAIAVATVTAPTGCSDIAAATSSTYVLKAAEVGKNIAVKVTGVKGATTESRWSASTGAVIP